MSRRSRSLVNQALAGKRTVFMLVAVLLVALVAGFEKGLAQNQPLPRLADADGDRPLFMQGKVSESEYIRLRNEYDNLRRGGPSAKAAARIKAIDQMEQQRASEAHNPSVAQSAWTAIGPNPIPNGQTLNSSVPVSGRTTAVAVDPTNSNRVYVGTAQGGVYRTLDGGSTWTAIFDGAKSLAIGALALAPSDPTKLYVGTGESNNGCDNYSGVGLYRIDNAPTTATLVGPIDPLSNMGAAGNTSFGGLAISKIVVHPTLPGTVFVTTGSAKFGKGCTPTNSYTLPPVGLWRSTNATGALQSITFAKLAVDSFAAENYPLIDMVFEPGNPNNMLVSLIGGGIYRTTTALTTAGPFTYVMADTSSQRIELAINKVGTVVTAYAALDGGTSGSVRKSTDGGQTWSAALAGGVGYCGGQCWYDVAIAVHPTDANIVLLGGSANSTSSPSKILQRSTTGGASFVDNGTNLHSDDHTIVFDPSNPLVVWTGNDGGIFKSTDGGVTWTSKNGNGFIATQFSSVAVHPANVNIALGGSQDNGTELRNSAAAWNRADYGDGGYARIDLNASSVTAFTMYHTYYNSQGSLLGFAQVDTVAGATEGNWNFYGCGSGNVGNNGISCADQVLFYAPLAVGPLANTIYYGSSKLYRSVDKGVNNVAVSADLGEPISAIGISRQNDNVRIAGTQSGLVYKTTTGGTTLSADVSGAWPSTFIGSAIIDPNNVNTAYVALSGFFGNSDAHVWKTTNLNAATPTWTQAGYGIPDVPVSALVVDPNNSSFLYAGTDIGVYASFNGGSNWVPFGTGLPTVAIFDMAIQNASRILRVATHGRGMWDIALPGTAPAATPTPNATVSKASTDVPKTIADNATAISTLIVSGASTVADIDVTNFNLTHSWLADLYIQLVAPDNTSVFLMGGICPASANIPGITLDDAGATRLGDAGTCPPAAGGTFKAENLLSVFNGINPNGTWTLRISDRSTGDTGTLNSWGLRIKSTNGAAPTATATKVTTATKTATKVATATRTATKAATSTKTATKAATATRTATRAGTATRTATAGTSTCQPVVWTLKINVAATNNTIVKNVNTAAWDAGADSSTWLLSGDGYVQVTVDSTAAYRIFGLGTDETNRSYTDVEYGLYMLNGGGLRVYEKGLNKNIPATTYAVNDILKVAVEGGVVKYYKNGALLYTSTVAPVYPLLVDTSIYTYNGRLSNVMFCGSSISSAPLESAPAPSFSDVQSGSTFYNDVMALAQQGFVSGYGDGTYRPDAVITRGQAAKMAILAFGPTLAGNAGGKVVTKGDFSDVTPDNPFSSFIKEAHSNGLIDGYSDGSFRPSAPLSRAEAVKLVVLAVASPASTAKSSQFSDVPAGSAYHAYIDTARANGIISGYSDGTFKPESSATRGQLARMLNTALQLAAKR